MANHSDHGKDSKGGSSSSAGAEGHSSSSKARAAPMPKDAQVMVAVLKDMGITDFEPRVVNQVERIKV